MSGKEVRLQRSSMAGSCSYSPQCCCLVHQRSPVGSSQLSPVSTRVSLGCPFVEEELWDGGRACVSQFAVVLLLPSSNLWRAECVIPALITDSTPALFPVGLGKHCMPPTGPIPARRISPSLSSLSPDGHLYSGYSLFSLMNNQLLLE